MYPLSYRCAPAVVASRRARGVLGVVSTPVQAGAWTSVVLQPSQDIAGFWPDLDVRDFGLSGITVNAVSNGDAVTGYVDYLRFTRSMGGTAQFDMQQDMMAALATSKEWRCRISRYPRPRVEWSTSRSSPRRAS